MKLMEVSAFTRDGKGGNLAGVALLDNSINDGEQEMQQLAKELKYSETAYIEQRESNEFNIRFFTVSEEVDLCGHATIASFHLLKEEGLISDTKAIQYTKAGKLEVICEDSILMQMSKPIIHELLDKDYCGKLLGISSEDIIEKPQAIEVGLKDGMVLVKDRDTLNKIVIDRQAMIDYSNEHQLTGFHVCAIEDKQYYTRNFGPACGIDEESATGTSSGSMYIYLLENNYITKEDSISFMQGDIMNQPSQIDVKIINDDVWVGGKATTIKQLR